MKQIPKQKSQSIHLAIGVLAAILLLIISSCAIQTSNLGKTALKNQILPLTTDENAQERIWQTKDIEVIYKTIKVGNTFTVAGSLSINDSVTRSFPLVKRLRFYINYLNENNKVISTDPITINTGYRKSFTKNFKLINVPEAPPDAVSFAFSYWGIMTSLSSDNGSMGDWEIYFDPFKNDSAEQNSAENGLFYAD